MINSKHIRSFFTIAFICYFLMIPSNIFCSFSFFKKIQETISSISLKDSYKQSLFGGTPPDWD